MIFKNLKYLLIMIMVNFMTITIFAQNNATNAIDNSTQSTKPKPRVSLLLNSSFTSFGMGQNTFSTSVLPSISLPVSNRLFITGTIGYTSLFNNRSMEFGNSQSNYGHIMVRGDYLLSEKITLRGAAYKTFKIGEPKINTGQESFYDFSSEGIMMDMEYKVNDNFKINVGIEYRKQNSPYFNDQMHPVNNGFGGNTPLFSPGNQGFMTY